MQMWQSSKILESFNTVYDYRFHDGEEDGSIRFLMERYNLRPLEVIVIAVLLNSYPEYVLESYLSSICYNNSNDFDRCINGLIKRKFLAVKQSSEEGDIMLAISDDAREAFLFDMDYGAKTTIDCLSELKTCQESDIESGDWVDSFMANIVEPINAQMKTACDALNIRQMQSGAKKMFWRMAWRFVHYFISDAVDDSHPFYMSAAEEAMNDLVKEGIVNIHIVNNEDNDVKKYILSPGAVRLLFRGHDEIIQYDTLGQYASVIKNNSIQKKDLFFSDDAQTDINNLRKMLTKEGFERAVGILARDKRPQAIMSLLWGPSGTGKTEIVKQLALETGRDIIQFDVSKVTGGNWGTTEKSYKKLFLAYNYTAAISTIVPIFLLNEADDILAKRCQFVDRAIDKSYNTVSNILLQEMERLNGILLATTNYVDIIDDAFYRRFLFHTRLVKPDAVARAQIWKAKIPELADSEANELSVRFEMSGAQIDNVVTKRSLAELYYEGNRGFKYIVGLCEKELASAEGTKAYNKRIGY